MTVPVGAAAPDFELKDQHGATVRLLDFRGRAVLLMFVPFAFTGICTGEICEMRDSGSDFANDAVATVAVTCDSMFSLKEWAEREGIGYPLLSDFWPHGATARAYGVFNEERGCALRGTFLIDADGVVRWSVVNQLGDARSLDDYRAALAAL
ncbi:MAG: peroxiredoxin [Actinomycetales bacterium]|nr:peroxiredoxin [Actinomycetales bacterium]